MESFTKEQIIQGYEKTLDKMVVGEWAKNYYRKEPEGFHVGWFQKGVEKAVPLMTIIESFGLMDDDRGGITFDKMAKGQSLPDGIVATFELDPVIAEFWNDCITDLGIDRTEDGLLFFIHVIYNFGPDENTKVILETGKA